MKRYYSTLLWCNKVQYTKEEKHKQRDKLTGWEPHQQDHFLGLGGDGRTGRVQKGRTGVYCPLKYLQIHTCKYLFTGHQVKNEELVHVSIAL